MTTIDLASHDSAHSAAASRAPSAISQWLTTSDHKRLGRLMAVCSLVGLLGVIAVSVILGVLRLDGAGPVPSSKADVATQLFATARFGLMFFAVLPLLLGIAVAVVPLQLGARSLAFPRVAAAGFWAWLFGMILVVVSIAANGGPGGGAPRFVALFLSAFGVMLVGLVAVAGSLATTILTTRAPGMNMRRVPFFAWSVLITCLGLVLMLPVAFGTLVYLYISYRYNRAPFGGNQGVMNYLGFSLTQPQTYVYILPAIGFVAELIPVTARRRMPMRGVVLLGLSLVGVAALAGVTQVGHPLPWSGSGLNFDEAGTKLGDFVTFAFFNGLPVLGLIIVMLIGPLAFKGAKLKIGAPFVFAFFGVGMILVGMVGGLITNVDDLALAGTVFEEGSFVYLGYGAVLAAMGAVAYWGPKLWGRCMPEKAVIPLALLGVTGTVLASLPMYIAGFANQPGSAINFDYSGPQNLWNLLAMAGHIIMALTVLAFIGLAIKSFTRGDQVGDDPWNAQTLEWATTSPAPSNNFVDQHTVISGEPLVDLKPAGYSLGEGNS
jgi:heme/copper-type cytochrome/quinol oxidase subunit 1